jgi:hypothetical protein
VDRSIARPDRPSAEAGDHRDDLVTACVGCPALADLRAATQDADAIGEAKHLVEPVVDEQEARVRSLVSTSEHRPRSREKPIIV